MASKVRLTSAQKAALAEIADANPPPEEVWENYDPPFSARTVERLVDLGLIEAKGVGDDQMIRMTAAGRIALPFHVRPTARHEGGE